VVKTHLTSLLFFVVYHKGPLLALLYFQCTLHTTVESCELCHQYANDIQNYMDMRVTLVLVITYQNQEIGFSDVTITRSIGD